MLRSPEFWAPLALALGHFWQRGSSPATSTITVNVQLISGARPRSTPLCQASSGVDVLSQMKQRVAEPNSSLPEPLPPSRSTSVFANATEVDDATAAMQTGLRRLRNTRVLAAAIFLVVGGVCSLIAYFVLDATNTREAQDTFVNETEACASAMKTSMTIVATGFMQIVGGQDAAQSHVFNPLAFKEAAAGLFGINILRNAFLYRVIDAASRPAWEAAASAAYQRSVVVRNGTTNLPAGPADEYLVFEMAVSAAPDRALLAQPGLDLLSVRANGGTFWLSGSAIQTVVSRLRQSQPAVLPPSTRLIGGKNVTTISLGRGIHISKTANFSGYAPNVTSSVQAAGYPSLESVAFVPPPPAMYDDGSRANASEVRLMAFVALDAGKLFELLVNATLGLPGVYGHYTSTGELGGKVAAALMEDISDLPAVLASPHMPRLAVDPDLLLASAGIDVKPGDGKFVASGLREHNPDQGGVTLHLRQEAEAAPVREMLSPGWLSAHSNAVSASVIFAYGGRQYLVSFVSDPDFLSTERADTWPFLALGLGLTAAVTLIMYACLWAVQARRRETLKRQREAEVREKAMLSVQNDVMALLSHEVRARARGVCWVKCAVVIAFGRGLQNVSVETTVFCYEYVPIARIQRSALVPLSASLADPQPCARDCERRDVPRRGHSRGAPLPCGPGRHSAVHRGAAPPGERRDRLLSHPQGAAGDPAAADGGAPAGAPHRAEPPPVLLRAAAVRGGGGSASTHGLRPHAAAADPDKRPHKRVVSGDELSRGSCEGQDGSCCQLRA